MIPILFAVKLSKLCPTVGYPDYLDPVDRVMHVQVVLVARNVAMVPEVIQKAKSTSKSLQTKTTPPCLGRFYSPFDVDVLERSASRFI